MDHHPHQTEISNSNKRIFQSEKHGEGSQFFRKNNTQNNYEKSERFNTEEIGHIYNIENVKIKTPMTNSKNEFITVKTRTNFLNNIEFENKNDSDGFKYKTAKCKNPMIKQHEQNRYKKGYCNGYYDINGYNQIQKGIKASQFVTHEDNSTLNSHKNMKNSGTKSEKNQYTKLNSKIQWNYDQKYLQQKDQHQTHRNNSQNPELDFNDNFESKELQKHSENNNGQIDEYENKLIENSIALKQKNIKAEEDDLRQKIMNNGSSRNIQAKQAQFTDEGLHSNRQEKIRSSQNQDRNLNTDSPFTSDANAINKHNQKDTNKNFYYTSLSEQRSDKEISVQEKHSKDITFPKIFENSNLNNNKDGLYIGFKNNSARTVGVNARVSALSPQENSWGGKIDDIKHRQSLNTIVKGPHTISDNFKMLKKYGDTNFMVKEKMDKSDYTQMQARKSGIGNSWVSDRKIPNQAYTEENNVRNTNNIWDRIVSDSTDKLLKMDM